MLIGTNYPSFNYHLFCGASAVPWGLNRGARALLHHAANVRLNLAIHARFLFIGIMLLPILLPHDSAAVPQVVGLGLRSDVVVTRKRPQFSRFARELGTLHPALGAIPRASRCCAHTSRRLS